jgi:hypothetical protein
MKGLRGIIYSAAVVAVVSVAATGSALADRRATYDSAPIYNEATKSYFVLTRLPNHNTRWAKARVKANLMKFRGVRGRLASIDSAETMKFIRDNFQIKGSTWVGARYLCNGSKLLWENGKIQQQTDYARWHRQWHRSWIKCGSGVEFMPLYLTSEKKGLYWRASGPNKGYFPMLVEFPTGRP